MLTSLVIKASNCASWANKVLRLHAGPILTTAVVMGGAAWLILVLAWPLWLPTQLPQRLDRVTIITPEPELEARPFPQHLDGVGLAWTDQSTPVWDQETGHLTETMRTTMGPSTLSILRYPGTLHADLFSLSATLGPIMSRQPQQNPLTGESAVPMLGLEEFLRICQDLGAVPLVTLNVERDTPNTARQLVRWVMGHPDLPKPLWELGDRPYARHPLAAEIVLDVDTYLARIGPLASAMANTDPDINIGVPIDSPLLSRWGLSPQPTWTARVLRGLPPAITFITLQQTQIPAATGPIDPSLLYLAGMGSYAWIARDLAMLDTLQLSDRPPRPLYITAHAPLFSVGHSVTDRWSASLAGALLTLDWLRVYATHPEQIRGAVYHSLANGRYLGTVRTDGAERPVATAFRLWRHLKNGRWLPLHVTSPTFTVPPHPVHRLSPPGEHPWIRAVASITDQDIRLLAWNVHPDRMAPLRLDWPPLETLKVELTQLAGPRWTSGPDEESAAVLTVTSRDWLDGHWDLPPHSITLFQWPRTPSKPSTPGY